MSYIVFLHQTTTTAGEGKLPTHCLISSFYIKPQLVGGGIYHRPIVLYRLSTSNHNSEKLVSAYNELSYIVFLHQTTTCYTYLLHPVALSYIVFLHQTTTFSFFSCLISYCLISSFYIKPQQIMSYFFISWNCLISSFYIKPQLAVVCGSQCSIVLYRLSTSNHNWLIINNVVSLIVLYRLSTSNHNTTKEKQKIKNIVLYRLSTSNHNSVFSGMVAFLIVLYRLSTSNHNSATTRDIARILSYIVFLHQTTTGEQQARRRK